MKNNKLYKVAFIATMILVFVLLCCTNMTDVIKGFFYEEPKWNLFLDPWEIEEPYNLATGYAPDGYEIVWKYNEEGGWDTISSIDELDDEFIVQNPGVYHWVDWKWHDTITKQKYEPIYGSGLWIYDPADR